MRCRPVGLGPGLFALVESRGIGQTLRGDEAFERASHGKADTQVVLDYRGVYVLASYGPLKDEAPVLTAVADTPRSDEGYRWVIVAKMDLDEQLRRLEHLAVNLRLAEEERRLVRIVEIERRQQRRARQRVPEQKAQHQQQPLPDREVGAIRAHTLPHVCPYCFDGWPAGCAWRKLSAPTRTLSG